VTFSSVTGTLAVNACLLVEESASRSITPAFTEINERMTAEGLQALLLDISGLLNAQVLGYSSTDYHPQGASATVLIGQGESALVHLDKSHLAVHTYFERDDLSSWGSFRCELELSTCGELPVEMLLERVSHEFQFELFFLDYRVRGIARDRAGRMIRAVSPMDCCEEHFRIDGFTLAYWESYRSGVHAALMADGLAQTKRNEWHRILSGDSSSEGLHESL
jgi:S-adenosylmethionine decarboxylase